MEKSTPVKNLPNKNGSGGQFTLLSYEYTTIFAARFYFALFQKRRRESAPLRFTFKSRFSQPLMVPSSMVFSTATSSTLAIAPRANTSCTRSGPTEMVITSSLTLVTVP